MTAGLDGDGHDGGGRDGHGGGGGGLAGDGRVTTTTWRRRRPPKTQPAVRGTGAQSATVTGGMRANERQARWADIELAGVEGADFTRLQIPAKRSC